MKSKENPNLHQPDQISRRTLLRRAAIGAGAFALAGTALSVGAIELAERQRREGGFEDVYLHYLDGFERVAQGDPEALMYLDFFKERRKRGRYQEGRIMALEDGDSMRNFYTAILPRDKYRESSGGFHGFAVYTTTPEPSTLMLPEIPITKIWGGAVLGHESVHVHQWLNGIEQEREDGFIMGEVDAYAFEFDVLDKASNGKFSRRMLDVVLNPDALDENGFLRELLPEEFAYIDRSFPESRGDEEANLRYSAYLIAGNLFLIDEIFEDPAEAEEQKKLFVQLLIDRYFGVLPGSPDKIAQA